MLAVLAEESQCRYFTGQVIVARHLPDSPINPFLIHLPSLCLGRRLRPRGVHRWPKQTNLKSPIQLCSSSSRGRSSDSRMSTIKIEVSVLEEQKQYSLFSRSFHFYGTVAVSAPSVFQQRLLFGSVEFRVQCQCKERVPAFLYSILATSLPG